MSRRLTRLQVGAGIQIPPNSARLLRRWGVFKHLEQTALQPDTINFRRWADGSVIGMTDLGAEFCQNFGSKYYVVHRADFHSALYTRAVELGVNIRLGSKVVGYPGRGTVVLEDGSALSGDLVIAADGEDLSSCEEGMSLLMPVIIGVKSLARDVVQPRDACNPRLTGFAAYRATVDVEKIKKDSDISWLLEKPALNIW